MPEFSSLSILASASAHLVTKSQLAFLALVFSFCILPYCRKLVSAGMFYSFWTMEGTDKRLQITYVNPVFYLQFGLVLSERRKI